MSIIHFFKSNPTTGLIFPDYPKSIHPFIGWGGTRAIVDKLLRPFGCDTSSIDLLEFAAGGFFWARTDALHIIHSLGLSYDNIPDEPIAKDDTILHAIERMTCISTEMMGYEWKKLSL